MMTSKTMLTSFISQPFVSRYLPGSANDDADVDDAAYAADDDDFFNSSISCVFLHEVNVRVFC